MDEGVGTGRDEKACSTSSFLKPKIHALQGCFILIFSDTMRGGVGSPSTLWGGFYDAKTMPKNHIWVQNHAKNPYINPHSV